MTPQELDAFRKEIKKRMIDLGLDRWRSYKVVLPHISARLGRPVNYNSLVMTMTGYRNGESSVEILKTLQEVLAAWPSEAA